MKVVLFLFGIGLATSIASAEDPRCENNRRRISELRREHDSLETLLAEKRLLAYGPIQQLREELQGFRTELQTNIADLRRGIIRKPYQEYALRRDFAGKFGLAWDRNWDEDFGGYFQTFLTYVNQLIQKVDRLQQIERELPFHEQRLKELNCAEAAPLPKVEPLPGDAERPGQSVQPSPASVSGGLVLKKTEIRPPHDEIGGAVGNLKGHYTNTATSATFDFKGTTPEGKFIRHVQTRFDIAIISSGNSYVLQPGDTLTIKVTGTEEREPAMDHDAPPGGFTGNVYASGMHKLSAPSCSVGSGFSDGYHASCRAESNFVVPRDAEKVTINFTGTGAMGTTVTYTWEKAR